MGPLAAPHATRAAVFPYPKENATFIMDPETASALDSLKPGRRVTVSYVESSLGGLMAKAITTAAPRTKMQTLPFEPRSPVRFPD
jgi:hypothetical protein